MFRIRIGLWFGLAVGYVLGAAAGRERYEQIRDAASRLMRSEQVQQLTSDVGSAAGEVGSAAGEKASEGGSALGEKLTQALSKIKQRASSQGSATAPQDTGIETHTGPPPNLPEGTVPS